MRIFDLLRMAPLCLLIAACNDDTASQTDSAGEQEPLTCEDSDETPPIDNLRPSERLRVGLPGWRFEPLVPIDGGVLACVTHFEPGHLGRVERWIEGQPTPEFIAALPSSRRILATAPGPDDIFLLSIAIGPVGPGEHKRSILVVRDGTTEVLLARDDLRALPPLLRTDDAVFAQLDSGEMLQIPAEGGPAEVFSPPCERAALGDGALFLLRVIPPEDSGEPIPYFRIDRQDLATGVIEPLSKPFCVHDEEPANDPSMLLLHAGAPWMNTRATITTLGDDSGRSDHVRLNTTRLRGLRSDDALYFFSGQSDDLEAVFYRLPTSPSEPFEVIARLPTANHLDVNGWAITPSAHYIALNHPAGSEIWRVGR